jgi:hypothetical protein
MLCWNEKGLSPTSRLFACSSIPDRSKILLRPKVSAIALRQCQHTQAKHSVYCIAKVAKKIAVGLEHCSRQGQPRKGPCSLLVLAFKARLRAEQHISCNCTKLLRQIADPPQLLHVLLRRLCSQMAQPPRFLHSRLRRLCSHMDPPPQFLHKVLRQLCSQMAEPPHLFHSLLWWPCSQMEEPPQLLQKVMLHRRMFSQIPGPPHLLHLLLWQS